MGWKTIEVSIEENVQLYLNNLLIKRSTGNITINLIDIDTLLFNNPRTNISIRLLDALSRNNVNVVFFNQKHEPTSYLVPINGHHNSLKILEQQISWTNIYKGKTWKTIIQNKIYNQKQFLKTLDKENETIVHMDDLMCEVRNHDLTNREGHAAKIYWHSLFTKNFTRDYDGKKNHVINSILNYGYAVLRGMVIRSIVKSGLDPRIALFHKSFSNFFALASDLMEPFRPIVDSVAYEFKSEEFFSIEIKDKLIRTLTEKVLINGKKEFLNNAIDKCMKHLVNGKGWEWVNIWD